MGSNDSKSPVASVSIVSSVSLAVGRTFTSSKSPVLTLSYSAESSWAFGASGGGGGLREGLGATRALGPIAGPFDGVAEGTPGRGGPGRGMPGAAGAVEGRGAAAGAGLSPEPHAGCGDRTGIVGWRGPGMYCGGFGPGGVVGGRDPGGATDGDFGPPPTGTRAPGGAEYPGRDAVGAAGGREGVGAAGGCEGIARGGALIGRDDGIGAVGELASAGLGFACGTNGCCGGGASIVGRSSTSSCGSRGGATAVFGGGGVEPMRFFAVQVGHKIGPRIVNGGRGICVPQPLQRIATRELYHPMRWRRVQAGAFLHG